VLSFLKPAVTLKDLIPDNHIDIHSHLLPNIDDGATSIENSLYLISSLQSIGISQFITTPHTFNGVWDNTMQQIKRVELETTTKLSDMGFATNMKAASEYLLDDHFVSLFQKNEILTLKDTYVLVEMSYINAPVQLYDILFEMQVAGYKPVLAHPERYNFYHQNFEQYNKLKNAGCLFQLNLLSTVGYYGKSVADTAKKLLSKGLIDFVGTDVHHQKHIESFDKKVMIKDLQPLKDACSNNQFFKYTD
jgi:tyrosine-protein phosphatase YwqE